MKNITQSALFLRRSRWLFLLFFCALLPAAYAQQSQFRDVLSEFARGLGPQSLGPIPASSFTTLYGTMDMSLNSLHTENSSLVRAQSGNAWTSKLGFYAQEYLGDQTTAFIRLESGLSANTGGLQSNSSPFNRGSFIGLNNSRLGKITAGKQYGALGSAALAMDPFLVNSHESPETYLAFNAFDLGRTNIDTLSRTDSTLAYTSPVFARSIVLYGSYAFNKNQSITKTHARAISGAYFDGRTQFSLGYSQGWCDPGVPGSCADTVIAPTVRTDVFLASATHDFGPVLASLSHIRVESQYASDPVARFYILGLIRKSGANLFRFALTHRDTSIADNHAWAVTAGVDHFLSPRTALYVRASYLKNGPASALTYNYDATAGGIAMVPLGSAVNSITLGVYHNF